MTKSEFLKDQYVQNFMEWLKPKLDKEKSFLHDYVLQKNIKGEVWSCDSIYSAYDCYRWNFNYKNPVSQEEVRGLTFGDSAKTLDKLSEGLRQAIENNDDDLCINYCKAILEWGGVSSIQNKKKLEQIKSLRRGFVGYLRSVQDRLSANTIDLDIDCDGIVMNAGFTKIYSLIVDDFIIYDGRVGAALGLLVRKYCEDNSLLFVPEKLNFLYGNSRTSLPKVQNRRNPSTEKYRFSNLGNSSLKHTQNNIKANWLAKEIIDRYDSRFKSLDVKIQLRAFEAALFMIGYDVSQKNSATPPNTIDVPSTTNAQTTPTLPAY